VIDEFDYDPFEHLEEDDDEMEENEEGKVTETPKTEVE
jgi:hypothetical protein